MAPRTSTQPTLDEIRRSWPPAVNVEPACKAVGISRTLGYTLIDRGEFPAQTIRLGNRIKVLTASLIALLEGATSR